MRECRRLSNNCSFIHSFIPGCFHSWGRNPSPDYLHIIIALAVFDHLGPKWWVKSSHQRVFGHPRYLVHSLGVHFITWMVHRLSGNRAIWPAKQCFDFMMVSIMSVTPVCSWIQVLGFRFRSRSVMSTMIRSILQCVTVSISRMVLLSVHVSHPYVIVGNMYWFNTFLLIYMFALRLPMMLCTLLKATQSKAILFLISGRSPSLDTFLPRYM